MPDAPATAIEAPAAMTPDEESRRSLRAMRRACARVVRENKAFGLAVIQWREGRGIVEVPAGQLEPFARSILEVGGDPLSEEEERALLAGLTV